MIKSQKLTHLTKSLTDEYRLFNNDKREQFIVEAPVALANCLITAAGIESNVDVSKLDALSKHSGITGGPREYFLIKVNGEYVELLLSNIIALCTDNKTLTAFINNFEALSDICASMLDGNRTERAGGKGQRGDVFYYDISLCLDADFKKSPAKLIMYSIICNYLRKKGIFIHC